MVQTSKTMNTAAILVSLVLSVLCGPPEPGMTYSGVVDAGSTGTRLNIYGFADGRIRHQGVFSSTPGLAAADDADIRSQLRELFTQATPFYTSIQQIPVGFYGTAGFRELDAAHSAHMLGLVREQLKDYNLKEAKIISGEEEGRLALMALVLSDENRNGSIGVIDMGGKSTQISTLESGRISSESINLGIMENEGPVQCQEDGPDNLTVCATGLASKLSDLKRRLPLNNIKHLYLLSYFHDEFGKIVRDHRTTMREVKDAFYSQCSALKTDACRNLFYLISFIRKLGIRDDKSILHIDTNNGINITWASGKGHELNRRYNAQKTFTFQEKSQGTLQRLQSQIPTEE